MSQVKHYSKMASHDSYGEETIDKKYMYNKWAKSKQLHDTNSNDKYI